MRGNLLTSILEVLKEAAGGYFVLRDEAGEEYVVMAKQEFDARAQDDGPREIQLPLPEQLSVRSSLFDVADDINREIALYQAGQFEEAARLDPWAEGNAEDEEAGMRVRFEPLKGDLPPELQE